MRYCLITVASSNNRNYTSVKDSCLQNGGRLPEIRSLEENNDLANYTVFSF